MKSIKNVLAKVGVGSGALVLASSSFAATTPLDFSTVLEAANFSTVVTSVLLLGANIMIVYVAIKGFQLIRTAMKTA